MDKLVTLAAGKRKQEVARPPSEASSTAKRIAEAAYELLATGGVNAFSLRAVAKRAKVRLASVQYHYPSLRDLAEGIIAYNQCRYRAAYEHVSSPQGASPLDRLKAVLAFNFEDIQSSETRRFFLHFWSLLVSIDGYSVDLLAALYEPQFEMLASRVLEVDPAIGHAEARRRGELIAALIEGIFITLPQIEGRGADFTLTQKHAVDLCLYIATGPTPA